MYQTVAFMNHQPSNHLLFSINVKVSLFSIIKNHENCITYFGGISTNFQRACHLSDFDSLLGWCCLQLIEIYLMEFSSRLSHAF